MSLEVLAWMLGAYLVAGIPVGYLIGKARGVDLREVGSGNIGASNAMRNLGKGWGLLVFVGDVAKASMPVLAASARFDAPGPLALVALAAILGHIFTPYLRFRGGKGVACAFGVFLVLSPVAAVVGIAIYLQTLWLTRVSAIGSLTATTTIVGLTIADPTAPLAYKLLAAATAGLVWERHRPNLQDILGGNNQDKERREETAP